MDRTEPNANDATAAAPQAGMVRAIGVFNLLFGGLLLLCGAGGVYAVLRVPIDEALFQISPEGAQRFLDEDRNQRIAELKQDEKNAPTEAARALAKTRRLAAEASRPRAEGQIDLDAINRGLAWAIRYIRIDVYTAPLLDLLMVASGLGLLMCKNWARVLAAATAALKLARLAALAVLMLAVVVPRTGRMLDRMADSPFGSSFYAHALEVHERQGGAPVASQPDAKEFARILRASGAIGAIVFAGLAAVYPIVVLVLLTRPGARAACLARDDGDEDVAPAGSK